MISRYRLTAVVALLLLVSLDAQPYNMECDFGAEAFTRRFGSDDIIPQTCFQTDGHRRCFYTFVPDCANGKVPLVYDIHDARDCPVQFAEKSGWLDKAKDECFVVVWPTGNNQATLTDHTCWDVPGGNVLAPGDDNQGTLPCCCQHKTQDLKPKDTHDAEFLRHVAKRVVHQVAETTDSRVHIDTKRIYMSGYSNGCTMSLSMASLHSDLVAAVCCMAGSFTTPPSLDYSPTPILNIVGKEDSIMPYEGFYQPKYGLVYPDVQDSFEALSDLNGCSSRAQQEKAVPDMTVIGGHEGKVVTDRSFDCWNDATVEFITLTTAGHSLYPTMTEERFPHFAARTTVDTTSMAWNFCKVHSLPEEPILSMAPTVAPTPSPTVVHSSTIIASAAAAAALGPQWWTSIWFLMASCCLIAF